MIILVQFIDVSRMDKVELSESFIWLGRCRVARAAENTLHLYTNKNSQYLIRSSSDLLSIADQGEWCIVEVGLSVFFVDSPVVKCEVVA